ncbi:type I-A CRISPR-associated protein Cas7/Csa2 [Thermococcus celericrescens]|uniref:Type I-A CRISPR-associated protein Cas7/Csa2 n=1 Tax=Thermococcus celericrescens TaxID=227598 RepID=A0A117ITL7_9EURY|nr:type I-A CRISPR-associated protein Cas7/Csa2 [Thermococcus celericrescens]KUH32855.1 type I-A CRISPR-associated protein Cas7/Csa2 [Thermococcus celericrescens]
MFLSVGVRFEANVEALNMVETAGNYGKHRRVPYLVEEDGRLKTVYVPAMSGESLAHAYQEHLVNEALSADLPVCDDCWRMEFYKSMNKVHLKKKVDPIPDDPKKIEEAIVKACVVEDVGGFLYAEKPPVRRSSAFQVSYALPVKSVALFATSEPQLHARHAQMDASSKKGNASEQMIYYVETGTALYGFTFNLDLDAVGVSAITSKPILDENEIKKRREASLKALFRMLSSGQFGAKLSRFFPVGGITELVVSVTEHPFVVTSPIYDDYLEKTQRRLKVLESFGEEYLFTAATGEKVPEEALKEAIDYLHEKGAF